MNEIPPVVRLPRDPNDPTIVVPYKNNTYLRKHLLRLCPAVELMVKIDKVLGDENIDIDWSSRWTWESAYVIIKCNSEEQARLMVGRFIRALGIKNKVKKIGDDELQAIFELEGVNLIITGYKPKTCRYEEIEIKVPAQRRKIEKKVIPAQKARIEKRRILVCDDVKMEDQVPEEVKSASEMPF